MEYRKADWTAQRLAELKDVYSAAQLAVMMVPMMESQTVGQTVMHLEFL